MWMTLLDRMLARFVTVGSLHLTGPDGRRRTYRGRPGPEISIEITDPALPRRLILNPELALGEGYMEGGLTVEDDDLRRLFTVLLRSQRQGGASWVLRANDVARTLRRRFDQANPLGRARQHVAHHYDVGQDLYDLFLDRDRQYSCAYFRHPDDDLETAQAQKKALIATKLRLSPDQSVLDIGCGWGGLALSLARDHGVRVTGVTLSENQHRVARERVAAAGLEGRVDIRLQDYREVRGRFDRIVSVGMFEHVGTPHYGEFFGRVRALLADDGVALLHTIGRAGRPSPTSPWILKYIFPGGYCPAMSEVLPVVERADLWMTDMEVLRRHYAMTLRHWQTRFQANRDKVVEMFDERFVRMWRYYLVAAEMTFEEGWQAVYQLQLTRRQDAVPLTRDYLADALAAKAVRSA